MIVLMTNSDIQMKTSGREKVWDSGEENVL